MATARPRSPAETNQRAPHSQEPIAPIPQTSKKMECYELFLRFTQATHEIKDDIQEVGNLKDNYKVIHFGESRNYEGAKGEAENED